MSDELIKDIENEMSTAHNAFSYCAMDFSSRIYAIRSWQDVTTPDRIQGVIFYIKELEERVSELESKIDDMEDQAIELKEMMERYSDE